MGDKQTTTQSQIPVGLQHNIGFLLNRLLRGLREDMNAALSPLLLTVHEYSIMRIIESGRAATQQQVAERYGVDGSSMVELVDRLEERELLVREKNAQDRRSYRLVLTPKGRKTLTRAKRIAEGVHKHFLQPLEEDEREVFYSSLAKLITSRPGNDWA